MSNGASVTDLCIFPAYLTWEYGRHLVSAKLFYDCLRFPVTDFVSREALFNIAF
jgi:hypothetical protein